MYDFALGAFEMRCNVVRRSIWSVLRNSRDIFGLADIFNDLRCWNPCTGSPSWKFVKFLPSDKVKSRMLFAPIWIDSICLHSYICRLWREVEEDGIATSEILGKSIQNRLSNLEVALINWANPEFVSLFNIRRRMCFKFGNSKSSWNEANCLQENSSKNWRSKHRTLSTWVLIPRGPPFGRWVISCIFNAW